MNLFCSLVFRSLHFFENNAEIEKELLKGIQLEPPQEINKIEKYNGKVTLKTEGQLYKENLAKKIFLNWLFFKITLNLSCISILKTY